ncbi:BrnT family toxin [Synechocystis salina]|uniref:BrnT family toxin n=1 Tax=Synechocystis salina LEGE 00031 TaxID=1828736 RepID=A0ABR9VVC3_9SYNC|nr:BrnT family toxin [Synechocystis salina LEGE 00041]MBE9255305.1 BrnT family toxin [Synechocystis salina LEGE 00031]
MDKKIAGFDWDEGNSHKCEKHGLTKDDIEQLFQGSVWTAPDVQHSTQEERFLAIGCSVAGRPMLVAFTFRNREGKLLIRPISARYMHQKEAKKYEQAFAQNEY